MIGNDTSAIGDERRIAALARYRVLDTPRESGFDDLAALAAGICGTPIAVVNFVAGDRQWFKAEVGLGVDTMPLETSFCGAAIRHDDFLLVPDATQDERFASNPLVTSEPGLRFYAGALLKTSEGLSIGSLCVLDYEPRELTEFQQSALRQLARQVMVQLELRLRLLEGQDANTDLERRSIERTAELDRSNQEREWIWRSSPDLLLILNTDGVFLRVNPAWTEILGYQEHEVVGTRLGYFLHPDDVEPTERALVRAAGGPLPVIENRYRHKDGTYRWVSWITPEPKDGLIFATGRHITAEKGRRAELEAAQDALRQSQKLEAIGQLTGGVAHDFNNLLTVIRGSVDLLLHDDLSPERRARYLTAIRDAADRAAKLTSQLLAFARRQTLSEELFELAASLEDVATMLRSLIGSRIVLDLQLPSEPFFIVADKNQFDTAIINMGINARDAMAGEGRLTIAMGPVSGIPEIRGHGAVAGDFIAVTIADAGSGISPEQINAIFEPFFTTKGVGEGTGLGLSQVFGFAKQSGGNIRVDSKQGEGTVFTLYLPRAFPDHAAGTGTKEEIDSVGGDGTRVLVVEDNLAVGEFATAALCELGYESELAIGATAALARLETNSAQFDVVFTDVVMPGMTGLELAEEVRRLYPDLPIILTSGYSHVLAQNGHHGFELLHKPYSVEQLSRVLKKAAAWRLSVSVI